MEPHQKIWYRVQWRKEKKVLKNSEGYNEFKENGSAKSKLGEGECKTEGKEKIFNIEDDIISLQWSRTIAIEKVIEYNIYI